MPTLAPGTTASPTVSEPITSPPVATSPPTVSPTRGPFPCEPDENGLYGSTDGRRQLVEFAYALETVPGTTDAEVDQIISDLEAEIAKSVVVRLVPECAGTRRLLDYQALGEDEESLPMLQDQYKRHLQEEILVGLSPDPPDRRLTDRVCNRDPNRCDLVRASLTIWTIEERRRLQGVSDALDAIEDTFESGELTSGGDKVVGTDFVAVDDLPPTEPPSSSDRNLDNDDDGLDTIWIIIIAVGGGIVVLLFIAVLFVLQSGSVDNEDNAPRAEKEVDVDVDGDDDAGGDDQGNSYDDRQSY